VLLGGAAARPALLARAADRGVPVLTTYGLTEACSQVTTQPRGTVNRGELGAGVPVRGTEVRITDGVIHVRGPTLLSGYLSDAGAASPRALAFTSPLSSDGWLRTTDLGRLDADGRLFVLGRVGEQIITGGENVAPAEVEAVLEQHPDVDAACVFGIPDDVWGETVAAALVPARPGALDLASLAAFVTASLAPHRRPRHVALLDALPAAPSGKLDRKRTALVARASLVRLGGL
jgi:O-succinylbenzoic acid--CoA ligase